MSSEFSSLSLAGLDTAMVLQLDHPSSASSHLSSLTNASCCTSYKLRTPSKLKAPAIFNLVCSYQFSLDLLLTLLAQNDSPSSKVTSCYTSFEPLPPVPKVSSFQLSFIFNPAPSNPNPTPLLAPPLRFKQSSANTSHLAVEDHHDPIHASDLNNPYTPWPRALRPIIIPPPSSFVTVSHVSNYSRPLSRSGARAPEPDESNISLHGVGCHIPGGAKWRKMKRNIALFSRRLTTFGVLLRRRNVTRTSISSAHYRPSSVLSSAFTISSRSSSSRSARSRSSAMSLVSDSLASWIEERNRASLEYATSPIPRHESMEIEEYERRGSWLIERDCEDSVCSMHNPSSSEDLKLDSSKYYGISMLAGQEAALRRRRKLDQPTQSTPVL